MTGRVWPPSARSRRDAKPQGRRNPKPAHHIMSVPPSPERFQYVVRAHWAIENCVHRVLDAAMNEDRQRNRKDHGPETSP